MLPHTGENRHRVIFSFGGGVQRKLNLYGPDFYREKTNNKWVVKPVMDKNGGSEACLGRSLPLTAMPF